MNLKHEYLVNDIYNSIPINLIEKYNSMLNEDINIFIDNLLDEIINQPKEIRELKNKNNYTKQQQKKRYLQSVIKELDEYNCEKTKKWKYIAKEIDLIKQRQEFLNHIKNEPFDNIENTKTKRLNEIEEWSLSKISNLSEFIYINSLTQKQIITLFTYDIKSIIFEIAIKNYGGYLKSIVIEHTNVLTSHPFIGIKKQISVEDYVDSQGQSNLPQVYYDVNLKDDLIVRTLMDKSLAFENLKVSALDEEDLSLFNHIISLRDENFLKTKKITVYLSDLLQYLGRSKGGKAYEVINKRIDKLVGSSIQIIDENDEKRIKDHINFFQRSTIIEDKTDSKNSKVTFYVSDIIHNHIIKQQTTRIYKKQIQSLKQSLSKILLFRLQQDRISCYSYNQPYKMIYNYSLWRTFIRFDKNEKKSKIVDMIDKSLDEFKSNKILVENYEKHGDTFVVYFLPLTSYEIKDLIGTNQLSNSDDIFLIE